MTNVIRKIVYLTGAVQGVGMRPYIYNLALSLDLKGKVCNAATTVIIDIIGSKHSLEKFINELKNINLAGSNIEKLDIIDANYLYYEDFKIERHT
ncbi:MAG: acylphosphatase [Bacillota bacterium]|nr:acylphosphatase [Bacillota bacterium]HHU43433.1 hypothetical protein [Clostridiales bacterium]